MMKIKSDNRMNKELKAEVQGLRGVIVENAHKQELPDRFTVTSHDSRPAVIITDTETGKSSVVPLFAYADVRKTLNTLFG